MGHRDRGSSYRSTMSPRRRRTPRLWEPTSSSGLTLEDQAPSCKILLESTIVAADLASLVYLVSWTLSTALSHAGR